MQFIIIARTHTCLETHTCFEAVICILMSQQGDYYNYGKPSPDVLFHTRGANCLQLLLFY